jgi:hypothetical protein
MSADDVNSAARGSRLSRSAFASLAMALLAFAAGIFLASHHPLWPWAATALFAVWVIVAAWRPGLWLFVLPAALPLLNFSPWTGWIVFEEFDLLVLGTIAGGFARRSWTAYPATVRGGQAALRTTSWKVGAASLLGLGGLAVLGLLRGVAAAGGWAFDWFDGYPDALNSLRVAKSALFAAALWPLVRTEVTRSSIRALRHLERGMLVGLTIVSLVALSERVAYPGLLNFSSRYRTTALFWEMHVGGAAIDAYLALATPFMAWALWSVRSRRTWVAAALLALLTVHACLTTFSRGVYVGVAAPLLLLGLAWWLQRLAANQADARVRPAWILSITGGSAVLLVIAFIALDYVGLVVALIALITLLVTLRWRFHLLRWRQAAALGLTIALMTEAIAVIGGGSFMRSRLDASERDFGARAAHWRHGLNLMASPADWLIGIGLGRLPARYARNVPRGEFSGALASVAAPSGPHWARLSGPTSVPSIGGQFAMTQRVSLGSAGPYRLKLLTRVSARIDAAVDLCEQHLLYERRCQGKFIHLVPQDHGWQEIDTVLDGPSLSSGSWYAPRSGVLSLSLINVGAVAELREVSLLGPDGIEKLANGTFATELAHWFPVAHFYFLPWHIDNLFLELLIERGVLGLLLFASLLASSFWILLRLRTGDVPIAPFLAASLFGALLIGSISSIMDVPRVAFLLLLLASVSLCLQGDFATETG